MATGLPIPKHLLVHGWIKINQQKMSKSFGNVIDPRDLYASYGADPVRYYLMRYMAITQDGEFSIADLEQKIGSDLADALGNLLNRMVTLAHKYDLFDVAPAQVWNTKSIELRDASFNAIEEYASYMDGFLFHMALGAAWKYIHLTNAYFHEQEPWKTAKNDPALFKEIVSATSHSLKTIAILLLPIMPKKMEQLLESLGAQSVLENNTLEKLELNTWNTHFMLKKIPNLFEKPEPKEILEAPASAAQASVSTLSAVPEIGIEDFAKIQLIVGGIEFIEEIAGSDKLLKLQVDFGDLGKRQILSGVKKSYRPEDLVGKQGVFILNLKPRKMMGFESHGMMLFAITERQTALTVLTSVPNGTKIQ
jgi:methionyl-tRNA synthetase